MMTDQTSLLPRNFDHVDKISYLCNDSSSMVYYNPLVLVILKSVNFPASSWLEFDREFMKVLYSVAKVIHKVLNWEFVLLFKKKSH